MTGPTQRDRILDQALALMSEHGSAAMSMRSLARACGLQVAAIYHYFPSKDALLAAVFDERRYSSRLGEPIDVDPLGSVRERLRAVFDVFWQGALEEEPVLRLLLGEGLRGHPVALPSGTALLEVFRGGVRLLLETHVPELDDLDEVTELFIAQVFSGFVQHVFDPDEPVAELGARHGELLCRAVLGPEARLVGDSA